MTILLSISEKRYNRVLQPISCRTPWFKMVQFLDGGKLVGSGCLEANSTLATLTIRDLALGTHTHTARYPGDTDHRPFAFDSVTVSAT